MIFLDTNSILRYLTLDVEIIYNRINDETIEVFHAMKLRPSFRAQVGL
jgi:hypothetical protein